MTRFSAKNRYATAMNRARGSRATSTAKAGLNRTIPASVAVNSHARFSTPPATPISSRIGRKT